MRQRLLVIVVALATNLHFPHASGQERVTPAQSRGGKPLAEPWADVPDTYRQLLPPDWSLPTDLNRWQKTNRAQVRQTVLQCLGPLPPRPKTLRVEITAREEHAAHTLERFRFHNGVDAVVTGMLLWPRDRSKPVPVIIGCHGHGGSKEIICTDEQNPQCIGPLLVKRGYAVAAIDSYFCGERAPQKGKTVGESDLFKLHLWLGRSLWGMMLRDQQCLIDYLETRPEVDRQRIGVTGMSMGGTTTWWLAAIDDRIASLVGIAGFTRYTELIARNGHRLHGIYYYVPGVLTHFDTEAIYALVAPRPMLMLSGDRDAGLPLDGIEVLEKKLAAVYHLHEAPAAFRSVVYRNTAHEYLPEMKDEMARWFERTLPPQK